MPNTTDTVIAIDILLEPDARMLQHAESNNTRLLKAFPDGYALDEAHRPHITIAQRFVLAEELHNIYHVVETLFASAHLTAMKLEAFKYYYAPGMGVGVAGICAPPTPALLKLQADLLAAVAPFTVKTGTIAAFTGGNDDPGLDVALIDYVSAFDPKYSGANFNPHVSTGVAPREYLDRMLAEPFEPFSFSPAGAAIYQLGPYGTAAKKLWENDGE